MPLLPEPGHSPAQFSRVTGLTVPRLRDYDERGLFSPCEVDPNTGWRRYGAGQVRSGRLLSALVGTGLSARAAARLVADEDRPGVLERLEVVRLLLCRAQEHLPAPGADQVVVVDADRTLALSVPLEAGSPLVDQVRAARRRLAHRLHLAVTELPEWGSQVGLPRGPRIVLTRSGEGRVPERLLLPWPAGERAAEGERLVEEAGGNWAATAPIPAEDVAVLLLHGCAGEVVLAQLEESRRALTIGRRIAFDARLTQVSLLADIHAW